MNTTAYEPTRLSASDKATVLALIAEEVEFERTDGGPTNGYFCSIELGQRSDGGWFLKRTDTDKVSGDPITYFGSIIKCKVCKSLLLGFGDEDSADYCPHCQEFISRVYHVGSWK